MVSDKLFHLNGIWLAFPVAETATLLVALVMMHGTAAKISHNVFQGGKMMNDTSMKEKPVLPLILSMSLPMVLSMLVNSLYNIVDSFFVAQISEEAMTALSLVYPVQILSMLPELDLALGSMQ